MKVELSRRNFLKAGMVAGVAVYVAPLGGKAFAALFEEKILTPVAWDPKSAQARVRIDALAKVTGAKVFARDIRAKDMPHWPQQQSHAFIVRATRTDRAYAGLDLSLLGDELKPDRLITAADLERDGVAFPAFYGTDMLLPEGKAAHYLGHAMTISRATVLPRTSCSSSNPWCAMATPRHCSNATRGVRSASCASAAPRRTTRTRFPA